MFSSSSSASLSLSIFRSFVGWFGHLLFEGQDWKIPLKIRDWVMIKDVP